VTAPDPTTVRPVVGQERVVFLRPLVQRNVLYGYGPERLEIGRYCALGAESRGHTVVGSDVWLGYRALVMPGVSIGHGAVVAAGSVVVGDVPPYAIAGGNPARVIRVRYSDEDVARLLRVAWWDWPVALVTDHARAIMAGTVDELEAVARENGLL
jgi:virginiamycin A acetyltransferase